MAALLIVDDEPALRQMVRHMLAALPYEVLEAADGTEALRIARAARPAGVLLDIVMPGLDGWAVLRALRADPTTATIPVLVVTGSGDVDEGMARAAGAAGLLRKPFRPEELRAQVARLLEPRATDG